jgi:hypothetical protein
VAQEEIDEARAQIVNVMSELDRAGKLLMIE